MHTIITVLATLLAVIIGLLQYEHCLGDAPMLGWSGLYVHCLLTGTLMCLVHWLARDGLRPRSTPPRDSRGRFVARRRPDDSRSSDVMRSVHGSMHE